MYENSYFPPLIYDAFKKSYNNFSSISNLDLRSLLIFIFTFAFENFNSVNFPTFILLNLI